MSHHVMPGCSPYKGVLGRGLLGTSQDADVTDGCLCGVSWNKLDAESPLPEGLLLCGTRMTERQTERQTVRQTEGHFPANSLLINYILMAESFSQV